MQGKLNTLYFLIQTAATHKNSATKKDLTLDWEPPHDGEGKDYTI